MNALLLPVDVQATCIGCLCSDGDPCPNKCYWLSVDRCEGVGVCSNCHAHVERWGQGDRCIDGAIPA